MRKSSVKARLGRVVLMSALACALVAVLGVSAAGATAAPTIKLQQAGVAPGTLAPPYSEVASPNGKTLYVASYDEGVLQFKTSNLQAEPKKITDGGSVLSSAYGLAISPDGKTLYIADSSVILIAKVGGSGASNDKVIAEVSDPKSLIDAASGLTLSPNGKTLYIANVDSGNLAKSSLLVATLSSATKGKIISSHVIGQQTEPIGIAMNPNGKVVYLGNIFGLGSAVSVSGPDVKSFHVLPQVVDPWSMAISPDGRTLYTGTLSYFAVENDNSSESELNTFAVSKSGLTASLAGATVLPDSHAVTALTMAPGGAKVYAGEVTIKDVGGAEKSAEDLATFAVSAAASKVSVSGKAKVGGSLVAKVKGAGGLSVSYKWLASGKAIKGATNKVLKLTGKLKGKKISLRVTAEAVGYRQVSLTSKATGKVAA